MKSINGMQFHFHGISIQVFRNRVAFMLEMERLNENGNQSNLLSYLTMVRHV